MYYTCVAKLFNDAVPFLSVVEQRKVAEHAPDRDKARHVLWQPAVWLRLSRARQVDARDRDARGAPAPRRPGDGVAAVLGGHRPLLQLPERRRVRGRRGAGPRRPGGRGAPRRAVGARVADGALPRRGERLDDEAGRGAPPDVNAALAASVALPPYLAVTCAAEWTLAPSVCARVLADRPEVDVNRSGAYLPSALTTWADAADDSTLR